MKKSILLTIILTILLLTTNLNTIIFAKSTFPNKDLIFEEFSGEIPHFFTHQLIADTEKAFAPNNSLKNYFNRDLLTAEEFTNFLECMYEENYTLIDIEDYITFVDNKPQIKPVRIYKNRKPFLLSFDDMSFDTIGLGLTDKLVLDQNNDIASLTTENGSENICYKESICILENFIKTHPLFSLNNARAVINPTGYNGLLGYRTNINSYKNRYEEIKNISPIISKLKNLNYKFGCHTYNHINIRYCSIPEIVKDLKNYEDEVISLIGKTNIFCFPCGYKTLDYNKIDVLKRFGYNIFFCVDLNQDYIIDKDSIFLKRMVLDRHTLRENQKEYLKYFNVYKCI